MNPALLPFLLAALAIPATPLLRQFPRARTAASVIAALASFSSLCAVAHDVVALGARPEITLVNLPYNLSISFHLEPLGLLFALTATFLWALTAVYAHGYLAVHDVNITRFFTFFAVAMLSAVGAALSQNLFTLFIFYEILTLSTWPLVAHRGNDDAVRGARVYLAVLMSTSLTFLLCAVVWTLVVAQSTDFIPGGLLSGADLSPAASAFLLLLFAFGIAKAALVPVHKWLPAAMVAPAPVSALLHAVAVVKTGVFAILKIGVYIFGTDNLLSSGASQWLVVVAASSLLFASFVAFSQQNLKRRLAYSTVSQLSYITLGVALAHPIAVAAAALHIVAHAFGKIILFMTAGSVEITHNAKSVSDTFGLAKHAMPISFAAFLIGALSVTGLPPTIGMWSKLWIAQGAASNLSVISIFALSALALSTLLNAAYLLPIPVRAFFAPSPDLAARYPIRREAPLACLLPPCIAAGACIVLFFFAPAILLAAFSALQQ